MNPYQEGHNAALSGMSISSNPYGYSTDFDGCSRAIAWNDGWAEGYKARMLSDATLQQF